jgi:hypothetical protein
LVLSDLDLLKSFGSTLGIGISITTDNEEIAREFEPSAPSISRRLELLAKLHEAGIKVHVSMAPLLPCDPERLVQLISPYTKKFWIDSMNYPEINNRPHLLQKYQNFFNSTNNRHTINTIHTLFVAQSRN